MSLSGGDNTKFEIGPERREVAASASRRERMAVSSARVLVTIGRLAITS